MSTSHYTRPPKFVHVAGYLAVWLFLGLALWMIFVHTGSTHRDLLLYLILLAVAGGLWLAVLIYRSVCRSRLELPELNVLNARPCLGEHVIFDVRLKARKPVRAGKVIAVLSCSEEVRRARRHETILPVVVYRHEEVLANNVYLRKDRPEDVPGELIVPPAGMQSFESHFCEVRWQLDVLVFVGRHLTYHEVEALSVQPVCIEAGETAK